MTWPLALLAFAVVLNFTGAAINVFLGIRATRFLHRVRLLDRLLGSLCAKACADDHTSAWRAWQGTMGDYTVEVTASRWGWTESPGPPTVSETPRDRDPDGNRPRA